MRSAAAGKLSRHSSCKWGKNCQGGCPAMASLFDGSLLGSDLTKCAFFHNGWYEKNAAIMEGWHNLNLLEGNTD